MRDLRGLLAALGLQQQVAEAQRRVGVEVGADERVAAGALAHREVGALVRREAHLLGCLRAVVQAVEARLARRRTEVQPHARVVDDDDRRWRGGRTAAHGAHDLQRVQFVVFAFFTRADLPRDGDEVRVERGVAQFLRAHGGRGGEQERGQDAERGRGHDQFP